LIFNFPWQAGLRLQFFSAKQIGKQSEQPNGQIYTFLSEATTPGPSLPNWPKMNKLA
jgi:hypothetical protein